MTNSRIERLKARFEEKYIPEPNTGCWLWLGALGGAGYGYFFTGPDRTKGMRGAHIVAYEIYKGVVPKRKVVRHTCDVPCCVNPEHLLLGTQVDNLGDAFARKRIMRGGQHHNSKITDAEIEAIRADSRSSYKIATDYGISPRQVRRLRQGKRR